MLEKEFKYYIEHQEELLQKYNGKYLVIIDENVIDDIIKMDSQGSILDIHIGKGVYIGKGVNLNLNLKLEKNVFLEGEIHFGKNVIVKRETD